MRRRAPVSIALLATIVFASCAGDEGNRGIGDEGTLTAPITLPEPEQVEPAFLLALAQPPDAAVETARGVPGAAALATVEVHRIRVRGPAGGRTLRIGAVAPLRYRSLAPDATQDADYVWDALLAGQTVVTFDAARELEVEDGTTLHFPEMGRVTVGALADNGAPNLVDALVDGGIMRESEPEATLLIVGAREGEARATMERELETALPEIPMRPILATFSGALSTPAPEPTGEANAGPIEAMAYRAVDDGFVKPNGAWVERNLVTEDLPIVGEATCHRLLMPQLRAALAELEAAGLSTLIDASQYGGCYVPRFIDRDPSKPLSMHAFGLAVDLNVSTNLLGTTGSMDPRVVDTFERWGFRWGGRWARPDPMHFELERLVDADSL